MAYLDEQGVRRLWTKTTEYVGAHSSSKPVELITEAEYDALTEEQKKNGLYFISDSSSTYSGEIYSTEQTRIGTWIDGKAIYRKCFQGEISVGPDTPITIVHLDRTLHKSKIQIVRMLGGITSSYGPGINENIPAYYYPKGAGYPPSLIVMADSSPNSGEGIRIIVHAESGAITNVFTFVYNLIVDYTVVGS